MKKPTKFSDTSIRVLETLKLLVKKSSSIQDIINHFEKIDQNNRIYTSEVILKYINTLKVFGYRFVKEKDKYVILNFPNQIEFNENELKALYLIENAKEFLPEENIKKEIDKFLQSLEKRFADNTRVLAHSIKKPSISFSKTNYEKHIEQIKKFEKYCNEGQKLKITYKHQSEDEEKSIVAEPHEIKYIDNNVFLSVYNSLAAKIQYVNIGDIIEVKQLPIRSNPTNMLSTTTFRLKGRLSNGYSLYEGEKLLQKEPNGNIVIINNREDQTMLLKRLMRYGVNCEIISPKSLREEMAKMIDQTLSLYQ